MLMKFLINVKIQKRSFGEFKEEPLPLEEMKKLYQYMKECGKTTVLEVVAYTEKEGLEGAKMAAECRGDILMGTMFFDSIYEFCKEHNLKYMPFVGKVIERPSILVGIVDDVIKEANQYLKKGVYGFDLLGYRFTRNPIELNQKFVSQVNVPVCIAGSVNSYKRL